MHTVVHIFIELCIEHPKIAGMLGLIFASICGVIGIASLNDWYNMPNQPEPLPLERVVAKLSHQEKVWAIINEDIHWDCASLIHRQVGNNINTEVIFTNEKQTVAALATFTTQLTCNEVQVTPASGVFYKIGERRHTHLANDGFDFARYNKATVFIEVCMICGRGASWAWIILSLVLALVGLAIYPTCLLAKRQRKDRRLRDKEMAV